MPACTTLFAALLMGSQVGAPPDVPRKHWAFPAVDGLFKEGLLKGYPSELPTRLKLDKTAALTQEESERQLKRWLSMGLYSAHGHYRRPPSRYELAVAVHLSWVNLTRIFGEAKSEPQTLDAFRKEIRPMVRAISAYNYELTKLGADAPAMIRTLNEVLHGPNRPFRG